ncbi:hypothetical protein Ae505Ps2_1956c [Pseudonocardia sp. Ae505_Ps2]|nr:hypothetical protein Ae505Ps2_1956c [Pseudonocardia sp. Ae505_Ps2]
MLWPNAETPCSRPPSPRCGESRYVPGAPARSPQLRSYYSTPSTTARHDQPATENTSFSPALRFTPRTDSHLGAP